MAMRKSYFDQDMAVAELLPFAAGQVAVCSTRCPAKETACEDSAALISLGHDAGVLVVADGVGGQPAGEQASVQAVRSMEASLAEAAGADGDFRDAILNGFEAANCAVRRLGGAATTLAVVEIQGRTVRPYHVGDSMILISGQRGKIKLQTIAHSPVGYAVEAGFLDRDEAMHHEERHLISNMIGSEAMHITIGAPVKLADRDTLLVASDGLGDNLHLDEIVERIRRGPLAKVAERLRVDSITRMNSPPKGQPSKPDDMTFIVYRPRLDSGPRRCRPADNRPRRTDATPPADQPLCLDAPAALGRD